MVHLLAAIGLALATACAEARTQHLVSPGQDWSNLASRLRPGDEIILMPGRHRPASFEKIEGEPGKPITIRSVTPDHPVIIDARGHAEGLHFSASRHIVLQDLQIIGAESNGINIDDGLQVDLDDDASAASEAEPINASIVIRRVSVLRTGPIGNTDGIKLSGLSNVTIEDCVVEGWGGSAIDVVGCQEVRIGNCSFKGLVDFTQANGIQVKGGSRNVWINGCTFENGGQRGVNAGGSTGLEYFRPAVPEDAKPGSRFEAEAVMIDRCLFIGGDCAVAFVGSDRCMVRSCTIINPGAFVFRILQETTDPRFAPCRRGTIADNIIVWDSSKIRDLVNVGPGVDAASFRYEENLWWGGGDSSAAVSRLPGHQASSQKTTVDPLLDPDQGYRPRTDEAARFGHRAGSKP